MGLVTVKALWTLVTCILCEVKQVFTCVDKCVLACSVSHKYSLEASHTGLAVELQVHVFYAHVSS